MVDKISSYVLNNILYKNELIIGDKREVMLFGITRIIEDIPKFVGIFVISVLLNILPEVGIVLLITGLYKTCIGGAHARTNLSCFIFSTIYFVVPAIIGKYVDISSNILSLLYIVVFLQSLHVIVKIAPADTEEIPIINKQKRKSLKILGTIILVLLYSLSLFINNQAVKEIVVITILFINTMATKPMYRFFKCIYSYESEEFCKYFKD